MQLNRSTDYAIQMLLYLAKAGKTVSSSKLAAAPFNKKGLIGIKKAEWSGKDFSGLL